MDPTVRALLSAQGGVASSAQVTALGVSRFRLRRLVQADELIRLRRGVLVDPAAWEAAAPWERHALRARGLMLGPAGADDSPVALSHHSALSLMGVWLYGVDQRVHVVRTDGRRGQSDAFVQCHAPVLPETTQRIKTDAVGTSSSSAGAARRSVPAGSEEAQRPARAGAEGAESPEWEVRVVEPALAVLQVAATFGVEAGLVSADGALRDGLVTQEQLTTLADQRRGNGGTHTRTVAQHANGLSESAGETRCRWLFHVLGLPTPVLQAAIHDPEGRFIGRVDFLFAEESTIVEFDGLVKYTDRQSLVAEKAREDALRALGFSVVRITWDDLAHPQRVLAKVLRGFQSATTAA